MRKSTLAFMMIVVLIFSFGCKKDKSETTPETTSSLSVKYDGTTWSSSAVSAIYTSQMDITAIISMNSTATQQVHVTFIGDSTGTFNCTNDTFENTLAVMLGVGAGDSYLTWMADANGTLGQIIVTKYDKINNKISGTFHFDGYNEDGTKKVFTEGKFTNINCTRN